MAFSHIIGGMTFTEANFQGNAYADEAAGFPKALEKLVEHVANAYHGVSADTLTVGLGARSLTITTASGQIPAFAPGMPVRIARAGAPSATYMQGEITAWDGATGAATVNITSTLGGGSHTDWSITMGGNQTTAGAGPLAVTLGGTGADTAAGARGNLDLANHHRIAVDANGNVVLPGHVEPLTYGEATASPSIASGSLSLDLSTAQIFEVALDANIIALTFANPPAPGTARGFTLKLAVTGAYAITWPAGVKWPRGAAPTLTATPGKYDIFSFVTMDGGATWFGSALIQDA
jgi:hypothetical protein